MVRKRAGNLSPKTWNRPEGMRSVEEYHFLAARAATESGRWATKQSCRVSLLYGESRLEAALDLRHRRRCQTANDTADVCNGDRGQVLALDGRGVQTVPDCFPSGELIVDIR